MDVLGLVDRALDSLGVARSRLGSSRFYQFPDLPSTLANGAVSAPVPITIQRDSILIAIHGQPSRAGTLADYAGVGFAMRFPGGFELTTDGKAPAFLPMLLAFGRESKSYVDMAPPVLLRQGGNVVVQYSNNSGGAVLPSCALRVVEINK